MALVIQVVVKFLRIIKFAHEFPVEIFAKVYIPVHTAIKKVKLQHIHGHVRIIFHGYWSCKLGVLPWWPIWVIFICIDVFSLLWARGRIP
jgi:hypothetical protein